MICRIGEGGPFRRFEARLRLTDPVVQVGVAIAIAWIPFVVIGMAIEAHAGWIPVLHDVATHVRLLVGIPVLLVLDGVFPRVCRSTIDHLARFDFIPPAHVPRYDGALARATRLGDSWLPEAVCALLALAIGAGAVIGPLPLGRFSPRSELTFAEYWYALVSLPMFEFLVLRSLWRWIVWMRFLVGICRVPLDLEPTHPDRCGGLSVLRKPSIAYCAMMLFVVSAVLSAEWGWRFKFVTLTSFLPAVLVVAALAMVLAFGPLLLFLPQILRLRRDSVDELGGIAARAGRAFRRQPGERTLHGIQDLAALGSTYRDTMKSIYVIPLEKRDAVTVLLAALVPMLPGILTRVSQDEWLAVASLITP